MSCVSKTRPYQHIFTFLTLTAKHRGIDMSISYEELVEFAERDECHYCGSKIQWQMWSSGRSYSKAYNLDRKDNKKGYSKDNCVVCCTACNFIRSDSLTYEEMLILSPGLRSIMLSRNLRELTNTTEFQ